MVNYVKQEGDDGPAENVGSSVLGLCFTVGLPVRCLLGLLDTGMLTADSLNRKDPNNNYYTPIWAAVSADRGRIAYELAIREELTFEGIWNICKRTKVSKTGSLGRGFLPNHDGRLLTRVWRVWDLEKFGLWQWRLGGNEDSITHTGLCVYVCVGRKAQKGPVEPTGLINI